jgi:hypothetical protein
MLRTSCQAPRTIGRVAKFRGGFFIDARNAHGMRTSRARWHRVEMRKKKDSRCARASHGHRNRVVTGRKGPQKIFLYNCAESASGRPRYGSNRANRRCPDSLQRRRVSRSRRSSRSKMPVAGSATPLNGVDPCLDRAVDAATRSSRAPMRARRTLISAFGERSRAKFSSALRRSRSFGYVEARFGASRVAAKRSSGLHKACARRRRPANRGGCMRSGGCARSG